MKINQKLAVATAGVVLSFTAIDLPAQATNLVSRDFTVTIDSDPATGGSLAGQSFFGSLSYDADTLASEATALVTNFSFNFPDFNGVLQPEGVKRNFVGSTDDVFFLNLFYAPAPVGSRAFLFGPALNVDTGLTESISTFFYGTTSVVGSVIISEPADNFGTVSYSEAHAVPEPRTIGGICLLGLFGIGLLMKQKGVTRKVTTITQL